MYNAASIGASTRTAAYDFLSLHGLFFLSIICFHIQCKLTIVVLVHFHTAHESQVKTLLATQPALAARLEAAQPRSSSVGRGDASSGGATIPTGAGGATAAAASGAGDGSERKPLITLKMDFGNFKRE